MLLLKSQVPFLATQITKFFPGLSLRGRQFGDDGREDRKREEEGKGKRRLRKEENVEEK